MNVGSPTFTQSPKRPIARAPDLNLLQLVKIEFKGRSEARKCDS